MSYECRIAADSISPAGTRATTFVVTVPRIILPEWNTHRMFSRNSASSRAVPIDRIIERVMSDPFIPIYWGKNQKGMQAAEEVGQAEKLVAEMKWLAARDNAIESVKALQEVEIHKQIANRLLEPWMWTTIVVTATEYENFFNLRNHEAAQPEIRRIAAMMEEAYRKSEPQRLRVGEWHLPFVEFADRAWFSHPSSRAEAAMKRGGDEESADMLLAQVSASRAASVSYYRIDERKLAHEELDRFDRLTLPARQGTGPGHWSPAEHPMQALATPVQIGNVKGFMQLRKFYPGESGEVRA